MLNERAGTMAKSCDELDMNHGDSAIFGEWPPFFGGSRFGKEATASGFQGKGHTARSTPSNSNPRSEAVMPTELASLDQAVCEAFECSKHQCQTKSLWVGQSVRYTSLGKDPDGLLLQAQQQKGSSRVRSFETLQAARQRGWQILYLYDGSYKHSPTCRLTHALAPSFQSRRKRQRNPLQQVGFQCRTRRIIRHRRQSRQRWRTIRAKRRRGQTASGLDTIRSIWRSSRSGTISITTRARFLTGLVTSASSKRKTWAKWTWEEAHRHLHQSQKQHHQTSTKASHGEAESSHQG